LRPDYPAHQAAQLGFVAALAICDALGAMLPQLGGLAYKWPNDVLVNGRKISGILLESEMTALDKLTFLIVGVGVNLTASPQGTAFPATSVAEECDGAVVPAAMLEEFSGHFESWKKCWQTEGFAPVRAAWLKAATFRGEPICVHLEAATLHGRFLDLDEQGALLLEADGEHRRISAGEIFPANR
jgi:BirA family biotin operon repressor/biotin-[acetyl-CoA-carboxylase] ligase